jgi:pimeloyl-ACP methyl ester carboxylesterase
MDKSPHKSDVAIVSGIRLHYLDWGGTGPTILFLTGFGDSAHIFDSLAPRLTDRFHVLGLTRRGHPDSDAPETGYDVDTLTEDVRQFLNEKGVDQVILVGHSMAGGEMTHFAAKYTARVIKLVYLDSAYDFASFLRIQEEDPLRQVKPPQTSEQIHASVDAYMGHLKRTIPFLTAIWSDLLEDEVRRQIAIKSDGTADDRMPPSVASALMQGLKDYLPEYSAVHAPSLSIYAIIVPVRII